MEAYYKKGQPLVNVKNLSSSRLDSFVIGTVLGNSSLVRKKKTHDAYFKCSHCKEQKELIEFKKSILEQIHPVKVNLKQSRRSDYQLNTNSLRYFNKLHDKFYNKDGTKVVTKKLLKKLTPLGLAVWYMDDGQLYLQKDKNDSSKIKTRRGRIWSLSFTYEEHLEIKDYFKETWNIDIKIYKTVKKGGLKYYIEFNSTNFKKFRELIKDYMIPSMLYKIDLKYDSRYPSLYETYTMDSLSVKAKQLTVS